MKPSFFLVSLLWLCPLFLKAQSNFKPGKVVTMEGDTLRGYIDYKEWSLSPNAVTFKKDANSATETTLTPANTRYFEITGLEAYQQYEGPITINPVTLEKLEREPGTKLEDVVVFTKINFEGELVDLLSYTDRIKTRYFYQEKDGGKPQELYYSISYVSLQSHEVVTQKGYIGQLKQLAAKYDASSPAVSSKIESARYKENDLIEVFKRINPKTAEAAQITAAGNRLFAGIGLNSSRMKTTGIAGLNEPDTNPISFMPLLTFGYDLFLNRNIQALVFRVEAGLTAGKYNAQNEEDEGYYYYSYKIKQQTIFLSPQFIYNAYNTDKFKLYLGVHAQANLSRYTENIYTKATAYSMFNPQASDITEEYPDHRVLSTGWYSYGARAGMFMNKQYEVYAKYNHSAGVTDYAFSSVQFHSLYLGMNYLFNK